MAESVPGARRLCLGLAPLALLGLGGCAAIPAIPSLLGGLGGEQASGHYLLQTSVELERANYRVLRSNLTGESRGLTLLLFLTVWPTSYTEAFADLESEASLEGERPLALVNVVHERSAMNFLLFSLPSIRIRADLVEFVEEPRPGTPAPRRPCEIRGPPILAP